MVKSIINLTTTLAVALGLSVALITAPVSAAGSMGNKKGPQASVAAATRCTLDENGQLEVNVYVTDKSSGSIEAFVTDISITPVYKDATNRGNHTADYPVPADGCDEGVLVGDGHTCTVTFDLCSIVPTDLRAINTDVTVTYGEWNGVDGIVEDSDKTVSNHCTDDPDTTDYEGGIYINYEELTAACLPDPD